MSTPQPQSASADAARAQFVTFEVNHELFALPMAVSYTHLDVYKRQHHRCANGTHPGGLHRLVALCRWQFGRSGLGLNQAGTSERRPCVSSPTLVRPPSRRTACIARTVAPYSCGYTATCWTAGSASFALSIATGALPEPAIGRACWGVMASPRPVSYTHLDVYKRQL